MKRLRVLGLSIAVLSLGVVCIAGGSPADYKKQVQAEAKLIQEMLAKGTVDEKTNKKTRAVAMLIVGYSSLSKGGESTRDHALKLIAAMDKGNIAEAKTIASHLDSKPGVPGKSPDIGKAVDFDVVMRLFSRLGLGLERELDEMMELKTFNAEQFEKLTVLGYRMGAIGELSNHFVPEKDQGKKTRKSWSQFANDLRASSLAVSEAAKAKKDGEVVKHLERVGVSCKKCHEIFRDAE